MKLCITSDIHLGDPRCQLITKEVDVFTRGPLYQKFIDTVGRDNNYLILAGDILDFSISDYADSYAYASKFFEFIRQDRIIMEGEGEERGLIYLCGNHDADLWHILQHQRSIVRKLEAHESPEEFKHTAAGIIDTRSGGLKREFTLDRVSLKKRNNVEQYGGLFFDNVTNPPTTFNFAYPNLYVVDDNQCVLITHGQYYEPYWSILGEFVRIIAKEDLAGIPFKKDSGGEMERMVELNFPLNQLACTGVGQAGALTELARQIERDVADGKMDRVKSYLDNAGNEIFSLLHWGWVPGFIQKLLLKGAKGELLKLICRAGESHLKEGFMNDPYVQERFKKYYAYCLSELESINARSGMQAIPHPARVIFGHTHDPIAWNDTGTHIENVVLSNTGGWVREEKGFHGAEIFTYESDKGFTSIRVRE